MLLLLLLLLLCVAGASVARAAEVVERDTVEIAPASGVSVTELRVDNRLGDVTVIGHDQPGLSLTVVKRALDAETLGRLKLNLSPDPRTGIVSLGAALLPGRELRPVRAADVRIDVVIAVPRTAHVVVRSWNGRIEVSGVRAGASLFAHDAEIRVTDVAGAVATGLTRGRQRLTGVTGAVVADSAYGEVALDGVTGESLVASVHEGTIIATRIHARVVKLRTTFGDISFTGELFAGGSCDLRAHRGRVDVVLGRATPVVLDAATRSGEIAELVRFAGAERAPGRLHASYVGAGGKSAALVVRSALGDLRVGLISE